jgi:type II secretory pathway component PulF
MISFLKKQIAEFKKNKNKTVIYGITDDRNDIFLVKLNDYLINISPITDKEKKMFFSSLRLLVKSGIRLTRSIKMLSERSHNIHFKRILATIVYDVESNGLSFSSALQKYPQVFKNAEVKMIYSGEISGRIEETLESIAKQLQKDLELKIRVRSALVYPATVLATIFIAAIVVMIFVVPKFQVLFTDLGGDLPLTTKILIGASEFLIKFWWALFTLIIGGYLIFKNWINSESGGLKWNGFLLKMPIFSDLVQNIQIVRITTNFSTLVSSGVPMLKALSILSEIMPNTVIRNTIFEIKNDVQKGKAIHQSFSEKKTLDPILGEIIEIGEKSGHLDEILEKTGAQYEMEVDEKLKNLTTMMEPLIILLVGGAVIFMAMAIMTPIFKIQDLFSTM